jgi:hypothetical protein
MLSTKNVSSNRVSPVLSPGNCKIKINSLSFEATPYDKNSFNIVLNVESEPINGEFQGFLIDAANPNGPRYKGQVGKVRMTPYPFKDAVLDNGRKINNDQEILKSIAFLADVTGKRNEVDDINVDTIDAFMDKCKTIFKNTEYINACIGGREWENTEGYINVDLHLPRISKNGVPMESLNSESSRLITFNYDEHVRKFVKKEANRVDTFEAPVNSGDDFEL